MATATQAIHSVPVQPVQKARPVVSQQQLAGVLVLRKQLAELDDLLGNAEDLIEAAFFSGRAVEPGPLQASVKEWQSQDGRFGHLVVLDSSASQEARQAQATYWRPGWERWPKSVEKSLARAAA